MARRKKGKAVHGWVVLDKPLGLTSTQALGAVQRLFDAQKAGHAGTLDPLATGILPLAFGEATKTVSFAVDGEKAYRFTVRWGAETTTDDAEGEVTATSDRRPTLGEIEAALPRFIGEVMQVPPAFSAIKVQGERAYDLARDGETVILEPRPVIIDHLAMLDMPDADTTVLEAECGKGTYVRAIARDLGRLLGCHGHVIGLRRTRVGPFGEDDAVTLDELRATADPASETGGDLSRYLLPVETALADIPELAVSPSDAANLAMGRAVLIRGRDAPILSGTMFAVCKGRIVALGEVEKGALHPTRVFNLS
jgi:tRNA pseudouridine55 synthase